MAVGLTALYLTQTSGVRVNDHGVSFRYSKRLVLQLQPSTLNRYKNYAFSLRGAKFPAAQIVVSVPLAAIDPSENTSLANQVGGATTNTIQSSSLNGHAGQTVNYREPKFPGDIYTPGSWIREEYSSKISNTPLMFSYWQPDGAISLAKDYAIIRQSLQW